MSWARAVIFITHNPHHAYPVGDRFYLLKRGQLMATVLKSETTIEGLTEMMAGGAELEELSRELQRAVDPSLKEVAKELAAEAASRAAHSPPPENLMPSDLELLTVGRISIDLYCDQVGADWEAAETFSKAIGGSPTNVAVAAARLGHRSAVFTKVGEDPFGEVAIEELREFGVDTRFVGVEPGTVTPLAFAVLDPPEDPQLLFRRDPPVPDFQLRPDEVDPGTVADVPMLWVSAGALSRSRAPRRRRGCSRPADAGDTVLDLDYRPTFWRSREEASARIGAAVDQATIAVGNREECGVAVGTEDPREAAARLRGGGSGAGDRQARRRRRAGVE